MHDVFQQFLQRYPSLNGCFEDIQSAIALFETSFRQGGKLLICGNGGSAADSEHIVGELMKGFRSKRVLPDSARLILQTAFPEEEEYLSTHLQGALPAFALTSQSALLSAISNDIAGDMIFAQQVYGYGQSGDVLLGISTSGNSQNVCRALQVARAFGLATVGLTGAHGGKLPALCDVLVRVPATTVSEIQELHLPIYHLFCAYLEEVFFDGGAITHWR